MLYKWNHKICSLLSLVFFTQHNVFEVHACRKASILSPSYRCSQGIFSSLKHCSCCVSRPIFKRHARESLKPGRVSDSDLGRLSPDWSWGFLRSPLGMYFGCKYQQPNYSGLIFKSHLLFCRVSLPRVGHIPSLGVREGGALRRALALLAHHSRAVPRGFVIAALCRPGVLQAKWRWMLVR